SSDVCSSDLGCCAQARASASAALPASRTRYRARRTEMDAWTMVRTDGSSSTIRISRRPSTSSGSAEEGFEPVISLVEALRQHFGFADDRHETRVAGPARHDVYVQVVGHPRTGRFAEVHPDVEGLRLIRALQHVDAALCQAHQLRGDGWV